jgi:hypothetical protein
MLKCTFLREYTKVDKNNQPTVRFVYAVTGSKEDMAQYKKIQGEFYRVDDKTGAVLYNTGRAFIGSVGKLGFKFDGSGVFQDNSEISQLKSIAEQHGANFGELLLKAKIDQMLGGNTPAPVAETPAEEPSNDATDVGKL